MIINYNFNFINCNLLTFYSFNLIKNDKSKIIHDINKVMIHLKILFVQEKETFLVILFQ